MTTANSGIHLLDRFIQSQDADAFSAITQQYAGLVYGACLRITGNRERAADAAQETFFHLAKNAHQVSGSLPGWLYQVAVKQEDNVSQNLVTPQATAQYFLMALSSGNWDQMKRCLVADGVESASLHTLLRNPQSEQELAMKHCFESLSLPIDVIDSHTVNDSLHLKLKATVKNFCVMPESGTQREWLPGDRFEFSLRLKRTGTEWRIASYQTPDK